MAHPLFYEALLEAEFCVGRWVSLTFSWSIFYTSEAGSLSHLPTGLTETLEMGCISGVCT